MGGRAGGWRSVVALLALGVLAVLLPAAPASQAEELSHTASASVADSTLNWNQTTTVHGSGWQSGQAIKIILYAGGAVLGQPVANQDGTFDATIRIPSDIASSNKYKLTAQGFGQDGLYGYVEMPLTIIGPVPSFTVASKQLHWNETTTVSGVRYQSGATITISLFPDNTVLTTVVPGPGNTFNAPVKIPSGIHSSKDYRIAVSGQGSDRLFHLDFEQVTVIGDRPTISLNKAKVARGGKVTVSGRLFGKGSHGSITLVPGYEKLGNAPVGSDGSFSFEVTIPERAGGRDPHAIVVTGQGLDGIFAYVVARVDLGGKAPTGKLSNKSAIAVLDGSTPPPTADVGLPTPGTLDPAATLPDAGDSNYLIVILLIVLLALATIVLLYLTTRRDVRRRMGERSDHLLRKLRLRKNR